MNKELKKLLVVFALFSLTGGMYYHFQEFWLANNNLTSKTISIVLSLGSLITCSVIFLCSNIIKKQQLKSFACFLLFFKAFLLFMLFLLNGTNYKILIKFITIIEYSIDTEIMVLMYPLIALINKGDKIYAVKDILYEIAYYLGVIIVILLLGKKVLFINLSYNSYLLISTILLLIAGFIMLSVKLKVRKVNTNNDMLHRLIDKIKKDQISIYYLLYMTFGALGFYTIVGILLTILVKSLNYSEALAINMKMIMGMSSALLGALILAKLTLKNNYINIGIKYIGRLVIYLIAILWLNKYTIFLALFYTAVTSAWYSHITDAPYINRFSNDEQLAFSNLKEILTYLSRALGTFICGFCFIRNIRLNFILAAIFVIIALIFIYLALYNYNLERNEDDDWQ